VTSGSFTKNTIPNCYFLQSHLSAVLKEWNGQGQGVGDGNTFPGEYIYWELTDPAYGCFNDLVTVTATDYGATSTSGIDGPTSTQGGGSITTTSTSGIVFVTVGPTSSTPSPHVALYVGLGLGIPTGIIAIWLIMWRIKLYFGVKRRV